MDIENWRENSLADYALLSGILISALLLCFAIILLANEAKRSATILTPTAFSEAFAVKTPPASQHETLAKAAVAPSLSPIAELEGKIALPNIERTKTIRQNSGHSAGVREVNLRKSTANLYRKSGSFQVGASRRIKMMLVALRHHSGSN